MRIYRSQTCLRHLRQILLSPDLEAGQTNGDGTKGDPQLNPGVDQVEFPAGSERRFGGLRKQTERSYSAWEFSRSQPQDNERQKKSSLHAVRHFLDHEQEQPSVIAVHPCYRPRQLLKISSLSAVKSPYWGPSAIATRGPYSKSLP